MTHSNTKKIVSAVFLCLFATCTQTMEHQDNGSFTVMFLGDPQGSTVRFCSKTSTYPDIGIDKLSKIPTA